MIPVPFLLGVHFRRTLEEQSGLGWARPPKTWTHSDKATEPEVSNEVDAVHPPWLVSEVAGGWRGVGTVPLVLIPSVDRVFGVQGLWRRRVPDMHWGVGAETSPLSSCYTVP